MITKDYKRGATIARQWAVSDGNAAPTTRAVKQALVQLFWESSRFDEGKFLIACQAEVKK